MDKWLEATLMKAGFQISDQPVLIQSQPWSSVYRIATHQGDLYFKTMPNAFSAEGPILAFLSKQYNKNLPTFIAMDPENYAFLVKDSGISLRNKLKEHYNDKLNCKVLKAYAELQQFCIPYISDLLELGAMDFRLEKLPSLYSDLLEQEALLTSEGVTKQDLNQLKKLSTNFHKLCLALAEFALPETLEHGDFHDNNILIEKNQFTFIDFGDVSITHPFFSLASFLYSAERHHAISATGPLYINMRDAYLQCWKSYLTSKELVQAFNLSYLLRPFIWALSFKRIKLCVDIDNFPQYKGYLAHSMKTLLNNLSDY